MLFIKIWETAALARNLNSIYSDDQSGGMNREFQVDESGMTADGYRVLNPASKKSMYLGNLITFAILAAAAGLVIYFSDTIFGESKDLGRAITIILLVLATVYLIFGPQVFYRRYRYRLDDDKVEIRRGIVIVTHTLVPIERIHQVQVGKGPINRLFGLADVNITTAGGTAKLEFLDEDTAESIASKLNEYVVKLLKERD
ncbi:MAG: hypothetical protein E7Z65_03500 [Thermoplasmata archaeon]|nr:hypothetical protein [Thermoplasmata archaeon]